MALPLPTNMFTTNTLYLKFHYKPALLLFHNSSRINVKALQCTPIAQEVDCGIMCECCSGKGWVVCDFCKGEKTNVKSENNRIYRRCPSCKAVGSILCSKCKVFKCVTFPDFNDGDDLIF